MLDSYFYVLYAITTLAIITEWLGAFVHKPWMNYVKASARTVFLIAIVFSLHTMSSNVGEFAVTMWSQMQQLFFMVSSKGS